MVRKEKEWKKLKQKPLPPSPHRSVTLTIEPERILPLSEMPQSDLVLNLPTNDPRRAKIRLNMPPRRMWGCNVGGGYCGETCFQEALMFFGSYSSQERNRYCANNEELKIGIHEKTAATKLKLQAESISRPGEEVLKWAADHLMQGHPVIAGWVGYLAGHDRDDEYDHIMPLVGVEVEEVSKGKTRVQAADFHDLYCRKVSCVTRNDDVPHSDGPLLSSNKDAIKRRVARQEGDDDDEDEESDDDDFEAGSQASRNSGRRDPTDHDFYTFPAHTAYAVAILGNEDERGETFRAQLSMDEWEEPDWGAENEKNRKPKTFRATLNVFGLQVGGTYAVLRFDDPAVVPKEGFLASGKWSACFLFAASSAAVCLRDFDAFASDGSIFYRVVAFKPAAV